MAKAIEKIHNSTFRQTANGLAEKAIKVQETDGLDTVDHSNQIYWVSVCRVSRQAPAMSSSREGRIRKLTKISCFAVVSLPNVCVSTALSCAFCILVHLLAPTQAACLRAPSSRNVTRGYPPEERTTTSRMRYTAKGKIGRKVGKEILLCTERLEKIDWKSSREGPRFGAFCAKMLTGSVALKSAFSRCWAVVRAIAHDLNSHAMHDSWVRIPLDIFLFAFFCLCFLCWPYHNVIMHRWKVSLFFVFFPFYHSFFLSDILLNTGTIIGMHKIRIIMF